MTHPANQRIPHFLIANPPGRPPMVGVEQPGPVLHIRKITRLCTAQYERPGGRQPGDRIVECALPAGHHGEHEEADTEVRWSNPPGRDRGAQVVAGMDVELRRERDDVRVEYGLRQRNGVIHAYGDDLDGARQDMVAPESGFTLVQRWVTPWAEAEVTP